MVDSLSRSLIRNHTICLAVVNRNEIRLNVPYHKSNFGDMKSLVIKNCSYMHTTRPVFSSDQSGSYSNTNDDSEKNKTPASSSDPTLLEVWFYEVSPYGSLTAHFPFNTVIKTLNPQDYPDMNKVIIQINYDNDNSSNNSNEIPPSHQLSQISGLYDVNVTFDTDKANMNLDFDGIKGLDLPVRCTVHVPLKFGEF